MDRGGLARCIKSTFWGVTLVVALTLRIGALSVLGLAAEEWEAEELGVKVEGQPLAAILNVLYAKGFGALAVSLLKCIAFVACGGTLGPIAV